MVFIRFQSFLGVGAGIQHSSWAEEQEVQCLVSCFDEEATTHAYEGPYGTLFRISMRRYDPHNRDVSNLLGSCIDAFATCCRDMRPDRYPLM